MVFCIDRNTKIAKIIAGLAILNKYIDCSVTTHEGEINAHLDTEVSSEDRERLESFGWSTHYRDKMRWVFHT